MLNNRLNESVIGSAKVIVDILPGGKVIPNTKITPTSITIHNTGNIGAPAKNNHNYQKNCNKSGERIASWHFTVDDKEIYQAQSTNYKCFHAGTSAGNNSSIGIEICMFNDAARQKKCYENAAALVKVLMQYHKFSINQVKQHYDWSKKDCPAWLRSGKFGYNWSWFKGLITGSNNSQPSKPSNPSNPTTVNYVVEILTNLNVRKGPSTAHEVVTTVKKGETYTIIQEQSGWGKLKSGAGWISLDAKYVKKKVTSFVVKVITDTLNVRKGPGTNYLVASTVKKGESYTIVEEQNGWGKLKSGAGWISLDSNYVKKL